VRAAARGRRGCEDALATFLAAIEVHLKPGALDPQGQAVGQALRGLGHAGVREVRVGKHLRVWLEAPDEAAARAAVARMCEELLANPVLETYAFTLVPAPGGGA
jgi:phosphoribosylformylglycinamidine synthase PurS subunit